MNTGVNHPQLIAGECAWPACDIASFHTFIGADYLHLPDAFTLSVRSPGAGWSQTPSSEQMAYALTQISAAGVLPALTHLDNGLELLDYHVNLRDCLDGFLVSELVATLDIHGLELHWSQIDATVYASVIGAGAAACIDTSPGLECLYLRYANALADALVHARQAVELPRSRLFLQTNLHERFDDLLAVTRRRAWDWLSTR